MKNLLIMRHAKSSWGSETLADFDRPLNKRGRTTAPRMAEWLQQQNLVPDLVVASSANRAKTTAELVIESLALTEVDSVFTKDLYHAPADSYLEYISLLGEPHQTLLMVGHNPGVEQLVYHLSDCFETMPTAAIAWFQFESLQWSPLESRQPANLKAVWRPKEI